MVRLSRHAVVAGTADPADSVAAGLTKIGWTVDRLGDESITDTTIAEALAERDRIDLVVHARYPALCRRRAELVDLSAAEWHGACDEPLESAIRLARSAHEALTKAKGTIIFLVPLMASAGGDGFAPFAGAAEGCRLLAKSLAKTWGDDGIRAHSITLDPSAFLAADDAAGIAAANALHDPPLGRVPDLESEVAKVIDALCADDLASVTGASLVVDGGLWMPG